MNRVRENHDMPGPNFSGYGSWDWSNCISIWSDLRANYALFARNVLAAGFIVLALNLLYLVWVYWLTTIGPLVASGLYACPPSTCVQNLPAAESPAVVWRLACIVCHPFSLSFYCLEKKEENTKPRKHKSHNPEKSRSRRREIAINGAVSPSRDRDQRRGLATARSRVRDLAVDASRDRAVDRDLDPARSREGEIAIDGAISRTTLREIAPSIAISIRRDLSFSGFGCARRSRSSIASLDRRLRSSTAPLVGAIELNPALFQDIKPFDLSRFTSMCPMDSMSTEGGSTSSPSTSSSTTRWKFDVFISFRGKDTRSDFTDHLYAALEQKGILTFKDDNRLERGKAFSTVLKAVEESRFAIVVFSRNYASSTWCLDELVKINGCINDTGMTVLPVFYDVDPYDVRRQRGNFAYAFDEHEERFKENIEKLEVWREALREVGNLSGWVATGDSNVSELIKSIVEQISQNLSSSFSSITNDLVGMDSSVQELITAYLKNRNNVFMIGICGMGGSGKTTLARVFYEKLRNSFEDILEERNIEIRTVYRGIDMIKRRLCHKKMYDIVQEMGMEIVRQESPEEPGERSRLWLHKDLFHVLMNNTAKTAIQAIVLDLSGGDEAYQHIEPYSQGFSKMCNLRLLIINNVHIPNGLNHCSNELKLLEWCGYSSKCLPSRFQSKELVELRLRFSKIEYLWRGVKCLDKLKVINLEHSIDLIETPDFTGVPRLENICLRGCKSLVKIDPSIGQLSKLTVLNLEFCQSLINLPSSTDSLSSLEILILLGCSKLAKLPENLGKIKSLKELNFTGTAIREVPSTISFLICRGCEKQFFKSRLDSVFCVRSLKSLSLSTNKLVFALPTSISQLQNLESLNLGNCIQLQSLPEFPSNLIYINAKGCSSLEWSQALLSAGNLSQPSISFFNCCKLVEYDEGGDGLAFAMLKHYLQRLIYPKTGLYETSTKRKDRSRAAFQINIPGLDVPEWLTHRSIGHSILLERPLNWSNSRWMGISLCALFRINFCGYSSERYSLKGHVKAYGDMPHDTYKVIKETSSEVVIWETSFEVAIRETSFDYNVCHLWLLYWSRDDLLGEDWNDHECSQINVVFDSNSESVKQACGFSMVKWDLLPLALVASKPLAVAGSWTVDIGD
uniref:TIR domain-containing protein n=1 Tax=Quercus lobata TaxID=97700 RepID=A0A7N2L9G3_QUELO